MGFLNLKENPEKELPRSPCGREKAAGGSRNSAFWHFFEKLA
jgi:hypothetical protein